MTCSLDLEVAVHCIPTGIMFEAYDCIEHRGSQHQGLILDVDCTCKDATGWLHIKFDDVQLYLQRQGWEGLMAKAVQLP